MRTSYILGNACAIQISYVARQTGGTTVVSWVGRYGMYIHTPLGCWEGKMISRYLTRETMEPPRRIVRRVLLLLSYAEVRVEVKVRTLAERFLRATMVRNETNRLRKPKQPSQRLGSSLLPELVWTAIDTKDMTPSVGGGVSSS